MWQGTLLEDNDVVLMPRIKAIIQQVDARGILQSIASRNNHELAWERLTEFHLAEYFLHPQINWGNKSDSVRIIANKLGISLDTVAFVDDQDFERDEVRFYLPEVLTIDAAHTDKLLNLPRMNPRFITNESSIRRKMYQADIQRHRAESDFTGNKQEFLKTLNLYVTIRVAGESDLRRVEELTIRTNQFNTTGLTYGYELLADLSKSSDHLLLVADMEDRYGASGTIGLALIARESMVWVVKLLITSCRVLSRGIGGVMIGYILRLAKQQHVQLRAQFVSNDRNRMAYVTYRFHGFYEVAERGNLIMLEHNLTNIRPYPSHITVRSSLP